LTFTPTCGYRTTLSQGDQGHDVAALQCNLNYWGEGQTGLGDELVEDGDFGGRTFRRVRTYQRRRNLYLDGICGPKTQRRLAIELLEPSADAFNLPHGLLRGQVELESAYAVGAVNCRVPGAKDCGWTQRRIADGSDEDTYRGAFFAPSCFGRSAETLRKTKDRFYSNAAQAIKDHEYMWKAAVMNHNWPAAAQQMATGGFDSWRFQSEGLWYTVDQPAPWIKRIGVPGVETAREWVAFYQGKVCVYVSDWTP